MGVAGAGSLAKVINAALSSKHRFDEMREFFDGGDDIQDSVFVDFAKNGGGVFCPNVELEILTPLPHLSVA